MPSISQSSFHELIQAGRRIKVFVSKGPAYHYTYGRWRLDGWWRKRTDSFAALDNAAFFAHLELERSGLVGVEKSVAEKDYDRAKSRLAAYFRTRHEPRFHFSYQDKNALVATITDREKEATVRAADQVCRNIFEFRRVAPVKFENEIDWTYCPGGNTDWTWDLNRHPYFITLGKAYWYTGSEKYVVKFTQLLLDWIEKHPAGVGRPNWESVLEVAVRLNTWIWAYFLFRQADQFGEEAQIALLKGLLTHARFLAARIERHSANNHVLLEAKALALCGILFPEFKQAKRWRESGLRTLWDEVEKQVCADGVHAERAPLYHRRILSDLLEVLVLLENNGRPAPEVVIDRVGKMVDFDVHITKPDGTIPLFSDSALTEIQVRFTPRGGGATLFGKVRLDGGDPDEDMVWLLGSRKTQSDATRVEAGRKLASRAFPEGGYFVMRGGTGAQGLYLACDCGPFGYEATPIHGHADALSFDLYAHRHSLIVDPGVYSYHLGEDWRSYFRGTSAHNTIVVDNRDQSVLLAAGRVYRTAEATLHEWATNDRIDFLDGSHDGYCRLAKPVTHRRKILFLKPEYWIIIDLLVGPQAQHHVEQLFHLVPDALPVLDHKTEVARVELGPDPALTIAPLVTPALQADVVTGTTDPIQGWVSFFSGEKTPAPVLRYRKDVQIPTSFVTVLYPHAVNDQHGPCVTPLTVTTSDGKSVAETAVTGLSVKTAQYIDTCVIAHDGAPPWKAFAGYESDAKLVYVRRRKSDGAIVRMIMRAGCKLSFHGQPLIKANEKPQDLALGCEIMTGEKQ